MQKSLISAALLPLLVCALAAGCSTLGTAPIPADALGDYRQSIEKLRAESDQALGMEHDLAYASFLERARLTTGLDPEPFKLTFPPEGDFDWRLGNNPNDVAEFIAIANTRRLMSNLHALLLNYMDLLATLNSAGAPAQNQIDAATGRLADSVSSLAGHLGEKSVTQAQFGIFGMAADEMAKRIVQRKRNAALADVMSDFHPGIVKVSDLAAFAVSVSASGIKEPYQDKAQRLALQMAQAPASDKQALLEQLLDLNDDTTKQLDLLRELEAAYKSLPRGHTELMQALRSGSAVKFTSLVASINAIADIRSELAAKADADEGD